MRAVAQRYGQLLYILSVVKGGVWGTAGHCAEAKFRGLPASQRRICASSQGGLNTVPVVCPVSLEQGPPQIKTTHSQNNTCMHVLLPVEHGVMQCQGTGRRRCQVMGRCSVRPQRTAAAGCGQA